MLLFFISSYCPNCCIAPPVLCVNKLRQNLGCKPEYDVILWRHKHRISSNNDHHTPLLNTRLW